MFPRRFPATWIVTAVAFLFIPVPAYGQVPTTMPVTVNLQGTIEAFGADKIRVITASGQRWLVDVPRRASVNVTGPGDATLLQSGVYVRFQAQLTDRQTVVGPIERIQVFTPTRHDKPGVFPVRGFGPMGEAQPDDARKGVGPNAAAATYDVVGRITGVQRGKMIVSLGNGSLQVEPAANLQVDLAVADIRFARPGDEIICIGTLVRPGTAQATSIQVRRAYRQMQQPGRKPAAAAPETPNDQGERPAEKEQKASDRLIELLTPRDGKTKDEKFQIENDQTEFRPCVRRSAGSLRREFGPAVRTPVHGILTVHGHQKRGAWQMWTWGPVKVIVDRSQKTRFLGVAR